MAAATRSSTDKSKLKFVFTEWMNIPETDLATNVLWLALEQQGVEGFEEHLLLLGKADIDSLAYQPPGGADTQYPTMIAKRALQAAIGFYHHSSRVNDHKKVNVKTLSRVEYGLFRLTCFQPDKPIVPFGIPEAKTRDPVEAWQRSIRPSKADYKEHKLDAHWNKAKKSFEDTLQSQALGHLIDMHFTVVNHDLDRYQQNWLFDVMKTKFQAPIAKAVIAKYQTSKLTRTMYDEIKQKYNESTVIDISSQTLSTYLTSTRINDGKWKGGLTSYIQHFSTMSKQYNEIVETTDIYTDGQLCKFLHAAVSPHKELASVKSLWDTANRAAGGTGVLTLEEYVAQLTSVATSIDIGDNKFIGIKANLHDLGTDGLFETSQFGHEANVHDMDTPVEELLAFQGSQSFSKNRSNNSRGRRRVMMDITAWRALSPEDKKSWDTVTDEGKRTILDYGGKSAIAKAKAESTNDQRQANTHEFEPDLEDDTPPPPYETVENQSLEASSAISSSKSVSFEDKTTDMQANVNMLLSQPTKTNRAVNLVETLDRTCYETYSHDARQRYSPDEMEDEDFTEEELASARRVHERMRAFFPDDPSEDEEIVEAEIDDDDDDGLPPLEHRDYSSGSEDDYDANDDEKGDEDNEVIPILDHADTSELAIVESTPQKMQALFANIHPDTIREAFDEHEEKALPLLVSRLALDETNDDTDALMPPLGDDPDVYDDAEIAQVNARFKASLAASEAAIAASASAQEAATMGHLAPVSYVQGLRNEPMKKPFDKVLKPEPSTLERIRLNETRDKVVMSPAPSPRNSPATVPTTRPQPTEEGFTKVTNKRKGKKGKKQKKSEPEPASFFGTFTSPLSCLEKPKTPSPSSSSDATSSGNGSNKNDAVKPSPGKKLRIQISLKDLPKDGWSPAPSAGSERTADGETDFHQAES